MSTPITESQPTFGALAGWVEQRENAFLPSVVITVYTASDGSLIQFQFTEWVSTLKAIHDQFVDVSFAEVELNNKEFWIKITFNGIAHRGDAQEVLCHVKTEMSQYFRVQPQVLTVDTLESLEPLPIAPSAQEASNTTLWAVWNTLRTNIDRTTEGDYHGVAAELPYGSTGDVNVVHLNMGFGNVTHELDPGITFPFWEVYGHIYECAVDGSGNEGNPASNVRVQITTPQLWILRTDNSWEQALWSQGVTGQHVSESDESITLNADIQSDNGYETISVKVGQQSTAGLGYYFKFWPEEGRFTVGDVTAIQGFAVVAKVCVVVADPLLVDDRDTACLLADIAIDGWTTEAEELDISYDFNAPNIEATNWLVGRSSGIKIGADPQYLTLTSLAEAVIIENPPPITRI